MKEGTFTTRCNVMNITSIEGFLNIKGGINDNCKDVYFLRTVGVSDTLRQDLLLIDNVITENRKTYRGIYNRINELPRLVSVDEANYYTQKYEQWKKNCIVDIKCTEHSEELKKILGNACSNILSIYEENTDSVNESMKKNLFVKLIYWYDKTLLGSESKWEKQRTNKIVICGVKTKQEYYFAYLLTLTGIDVLLIQTNTDIEVSLDRLKFSTSIKIGEYEAYQIPNYEACNNNIMCKENQTKQEKRIEETHSKVDTRRPERDTRTQESKNRTPVNSTCSKVSNPNKPIESKKEQECRELDFEELALLAASVVMIAIHDTNGNIIGTGSGIMIGKNGFILTNNHVASGGVFYSVRIEDDETIYKTDEVIKYNQVLDLAVIRIQRTLNTIAVYKGKKKLVRGQKVVAIGSPLGLFNSVSNGIISGFRDINGVDMIQFTAPISHGSSGGAVLNMYGEIIGISTAGMDSGQNINLAVDYECINNFVKGFI